MKGTKAKLDYEKMIQFSIPRRMGARPQMKIKEDGRVSISSMIIEDLLKKDGDLRVDFRLQTATFCGQQGRISRPVRAILSGQF